MVTSSSSIHSGFRGHSNLFLGPPTYSGGFSPGPGILPPWNRARIQSVMPTRAGYRPVITAARVGEHTAQAA